MEPFSHIVRGNASTNHHNLCVPRSSGPRYCEVMENESKNGGPNHLRAWREHRKLSQNQLAERVGTNANMIGYLESGERGLSAKWLRRLADALETTPGHLLDHDPGEMPADILDIWSHIGKRDREQAVRILSTFTKTGTDD